jgi:phage baseplate assembly protein gpV
MAGNSININSDVNTVNIQPDNNKITVVNPDNTSVNITQPVTNVIQVATPGPAGPAGPTGPTGPSGSFETGSFVTTSSFNSFTSSIQTEVDNLTSQTSSYVLNSQTGSFATTGSNNFIGNQVITGSVDVKNGNINIESNSYFFQGTSTGGNNVSLIGVNNQDEIYIGNQGYDNIIAGATNIEGNTQITGSLTVSGNISSSGIVYGTTGSFSHLQGNSPITVGDSITFQQPITASSLTSNNNSIFLGFDENNLNNNYIYIEDGGDLFILGYGGGVEIGSGGGYQINVYDTMEFTTPSQTSLTLNDLYAVFQVPITTTNVTASGNISASSFIGDGSQITGIVSSSYALTASYAENAGGGAGFPFEGDAVISGSLLINAFSTTSQSLSVIGSGSTVFDVIGSVGTLFSVDDDLTGTLFTVNDISGFPVLEASASGDVYIGKSPQSLYTTAIVSSTTAATTHSLSSLSTSSYDGAFFEYTAHSGSNARAGNIMSTWNGGNIVYTETNTLDIGDTSDLTTEVIISGSTARLVAYGANAGYKIKTIIKAI